MPSPKKLYIRCYQTDCASELQLFAELRELRKHKTEQILLQLYGRTFSAKVPKTASHQTRCYAGATAAIILRNLGMLR